MKRESDGDPIKYLHEQMALMKEKMQKIKAEGKRPVLASAFISPDTERPDRETQVYLSISILGIRLCNDSHSCNLIET
ncbi:hypothetical protein PGT21_012739 [Puccinia graminis f. sp. tritici]|uniref:Uncharacterized protein n=1 Tax=Puccinia graminis f. sp. tritici TaxID=56615 RepID=A0A5B0R0C8_PUCGR|nr:hypothetical protein PGT21_012739 [Puccinia graminis f. sp. tritici]